MIVPHVRTPILLSSLPEILDAGFHAAAGTCPGVDALGILIAQIVQEHGRENGYLKAVWNHNLGNVDATPEERDDPAIEVFVTVPECEGPSCSARYVHVRRAFASPEEGAEAFVGSLWARYPAAFFALGSGPATYVERLKEAGYFTGDVEIYRANVVSLSKTAAGWVEEWRGGES